MRAESDTGVRIGDWSLQRARRPATRRHRYVARVGSADAGVRPRAAAGRHAAACCCRATPAFAQGPDPSQASHYYSQPQLRVHGRLQRDRRRTSVHGRAWLDHEWSDELMPPEAVGWDWIGMNLDDGGALTAFRLRRADGSALWAGGSYRGADGHVRIFAADEVRFTPQRRWTQPRHAARAIRCSGRSTPRPDASRCVRCSMRRNSTAAPAPARSTGKA